MAYTLTRAEGPAEGKPRYPVDRRQRVEDPVKQQLERNVFTGKLSEVLNSAVNWGRKIPSGPTTSGCPVAMWK